MYFVIAVVVVLMLVVVALLAVYLVRSCLCVGEFDLALAVLPLRSFAAVVATVLSYPRQVVEVQSSWST